MMEQKFLKLQTRNGIAIIINAYFIESMVSRHADAEKYNDDSLAYTRIVMVSGASYDVVETEEMLKNALYND